MKKRSEKYDYIIARIKCPKVMECPINGPVISCKECRRTVKQDAATVIFTLQVENAQLRHRLSEAISACSRIAEWAQNTGHDYVEGIAREFLEGDG